MANDGADQIARTLHTPERTPHLRISNLTPCHGAHVVAVSVKNDKSSIELVEVI